MKAETHPTVTQTAQALRERERMLATLLANLPGMAYRCGNDADWTMMFVSHGCYPLTGYQPEELICNSRVSYASCIHPDDRQAVWEAVQRGVAQHQPYQMTYRITTAAGEAKWVWEQGCALYDAADAPMALEGLVMDITERVQAEQRLRESEQRYRALLDSAHDSVLLLRDGRIIDGNHRAEEIYGHPLAQLRGLTPDDFSPPFQPDGASSAELARHYLSEAIAGRPQQFEWEHLRPDGTRFTVEVSLSRISDDDQTLFSVARDITNRLRTIARLNAVNARFRNVLESISDGFLALDDQMVVTDFNAAAERLLNRRRDEIIGRHLCDAFPEVRGSAFEEYYTRAAREKTAETFDIYFPVPPYENWYTGRVFPLEHGLSVFFQITTAHRQAMDALQASETRYRRLFDDAVLGIFQSSADGKMITANPAYARMFGYDSADEVMAAVKDIATDLYAEPSRRPAIVQQIMGSPVPIVVEDVFRRKDGSLFIGNLHAWMVRDAAGNFLNLEGFIEDITERKQAEAEKATLEAQLRQQQKLEAIGTLASGVAHEINNPINGIMNYAQLIVDRTEAGPVHDYAARIIRETERVAAIVRHLLTFSRQDTHSHSPARVIDIVEETLSLTRTVLRHDQIRLIVEVPEDLPTVRCRSQQIEQVLMNLLTNARDALNARYPGSHDDKVIIIRATPTEQAGSRWVLLEVEDHGAGIAPEIQDRIYDPFFTTKPKEQGTGLGLSISHGIIKEHGGTLSFTCDPGSATRFFFALPGCH